MLKRKVLLAEDDEDDQQFFNDFLKTRNDLILMPIAENGEVLFEFLQSITDDSELPDLIVLDQNMPKINGLQALQLLKASDRYMHIPVCIYSTYMDETLAKKGIEKGACQVLSKPLTKAGYDNMIEVLLKVCG